MQRRGNREDGGGASDRRGTVVGYEIGSVVARRATQRNCGTGTGTETEAEAEAKPERGSKRRRSGDGSQEANSRTGGSEAASERCNLDVRKTVILRIQLLRADPQPGATRVSIYTGPTSTRNHARWPPARPPNPYLSIRPPVRSLATRPLAFHANLAYPCPPFPWPRISQSNLASASASRSCTLCASNDRSRLPIAAVDRVACMLVCPAVGVAEGAMAGAVVGVMAGAMVGEMLGESETG